MAEFIHSITVEFEDVDCYGIIHHPKALYFCERARAAFLRQNSIRVTGESPFGLVLRDVSIKYRNQLVMFDKAEVYVRAKKINKMSFVWDYVIKKDGKNAILCEIEMVAIDINTKKLMPLPEDLRQALKIIEISE